MPILLTHSKASTSHSLLPKDPVKRAQIRFFIEHYSSKINSLFPKVLASLNDKEALNNIQTQYRDGFKRVRSPISFSFFHLNILFFSLFTLLPLLNAVQPTTPRAVSHRPLLPR